MKPIVRALLTDLFDYAGLFPPAELPLEASVAEYAEHLIGPHASLLARFVCPASSKK